MIKQREALVPAVLVLARFLGLSVPGSFPFSHVKVVLRLVSPLRAKLGIGNLKPYESTYTYERMWSKEQLEWRLGNPSQRYTLQELDGFVVEADTEKFGIKAILGVFDQNLRPEIKIAKPVALNPLKLWMGIDHGLDWGASRYYDIPARLRPSPLNLIFKDLGVGIELNSEDARFQAIDFDAY